MGGFALHHPGESFLPLPSMAYYLFSITSYSLNKNSADSAVVQAILLVFLTMAGACVGCFLLYHLWLIQSGSTTYERIRLQEDQEPVGASARMLDNGRGQSGPCFPVGQSINALRRWWNNGDDREHRSGQSAAYLFWEVTCPYAALQASRKMQ